MKRLILITSLFCLAGFSSNAFAQGPPIITDTPILLGLKGGGVRTFARFVNRTTILENGKRIDNPANIRMRRWVFPVVVPYNFLSDKLQVRLILPFISGSLQNNEAIKVRSTNSGIGDVDFSAKYEVFRKDGKNKTFRIASRFGLKLPTGDDDNVPSLGRGSVNYYVSSVAGFLRGRIGLYAEGIYAINTSNSNIDFGNELSYNFAFGYRLFPKNYKTYPSPQLNGFIELNGSTANKNKLLDEILDSTGGTTIFLSPGIQFIGGRRWLIETTFQYPIINKPNGIQLATDWTFLFGTRILLF